MYRYDKFSWPNASRGQHRKRIVSVEKNCPTVDVTFHPALPVMQVDPLYMSLSIDISVLAGGYWWEGSQSVKRGLGVNRIPALDLTQPRLDKYIAALAPFYLRIGGSEADKVSYLEQTCKDNLFIAESQWHELHNLLSRHKLKLFFTAKYGLFQRQQHGSWEGQELETLLQHSLQQSLQMEVIELGNELNAYWIFHGLSAQPGPKKLARDYNTFAAMVRKYYPSAKICGPGSAYWPKIGEAGAPFSNLTRSFLEQVDPSSIDIIDWHYYPYQSRRSPIRTRTATQNAMLNPKSFGDFAKYTRTLLHWRDRYQPHAELWTGESGSAQCGGQPGLSDRWISSFWWADQLGQGAQLGQKVMIRQSLIGGEYGLLDRVSLTPRPDFWVSFMWANLMGDHAIPVLVADDKIRAYCHSSKDGQSKTLMLINLSPHMKQIDSTALGTVVDQYEITADSLDAENVYINAIASEELADHLEFSSIPVDEVAPFIKPFSINFWTIGNSRLS
ncbi:hypothetical protein TDB9533_00705 [Thalassocella blandensis]|nr:hypothetical protein TDB9533_00705 [Thalassocella blandensis]